MEARYIFQNSALILANCDSNTSLDVTGLRHDPRVDWVHSNRGISWGDGFSVSSHIRVSIFGSDRSQKSHCWGTISIDRHLRASGNKHTGILEFDTRFVIDFDEKLLVLTLDRMDHSKIDPRMLELH
jgi:hypothetical protein